MISKLLGAGWVPYALAMGLGAAILSYTYHLGGKYTAAAWEARYSQLQADYASAALVESTRQAEANKAAKEREAIRIATIEAQSAALQDLQRKLDDEQDNDPTVSADCINDAGRLRLNQIN